MTTDQTSPIRVTRLPLQTPPLKPPRRLIGSPVIRIRCKPPRINNITFSNRLKTAPLPFCDLSSAAHLLCKPCPQLRTLDAQAKLRLIGLPAIRIGRKPPGINHIHFSNRHETPHVSRASSTPASNSSEAPPLAPLQPSQSLIENLSIRNYAQVPPNQQHSIFLIACPPWRENFQPSFLPLRTEQKDPK